MISIYSNDETTRVINSRASKKKPLVWRRRQEPSSGRTFTTYERPSLADNKPIERPDGTKDTFNLGRLIISIAQAFSHNTQTARYESLWLAQTVEDELSLSSEPLSPQRIAQTTHRVLKRYDELAAVQYGAKHGLITTTRRPGRPSLSENAS